MHFIIQFLFYILLRRFYRTPLKVHFSIVIIYSSILINVNAQNFTYSPTKSGCNGTWGDSDCWTRSIISIPSGCTNNASSPPPFSRTASNGCEISVSISNNLTLTGNVYFGGLFRNLTISNNATVTITGNLYFQTGSNVTINLINGGKLKVLGTTGILMDKNSIVTIVGDSSGRLDAPQIDFDNGAELNLESGGAAYFSGETKLSGQDVILNIFGLYRTNEIDIAGKATLNMDSPGLLLVENRFKMQGQSSVLIRGLSVVEVGGQFQSNSNQITLEVEPTSSFYVCGGIFNPDSVPPAVRSEITEGADNCRILPVTIISWEAYFEPKERKAILEFKTGSESNISHYEVERSVNGIDNFEKISELNAEGFSKSINGYSLIDSILPVFKSTIYYRIRAVEFDHHYSFSELRRIENPGIPKTSGSWLAYPNPTNGFDLNLELLETLESTPTDIRFRIFSRLNETEMISAGSLEELRQSIQTVLKNSPKGLIIIDIYWNGKNEKIKLILS